MAAKNSTAAVVVVGAGPSGLIQALYLAKVKHRPVVVVEQGPDAGGMFKSKETPWGLIDQGVHIPQECGIQLLDELLFDCLPSDQWHIFDGVRKDIAGHYFAGRLSEGTLFPDIRNLPADDYTRCLGELLARAGRPPLGFEQANNLEGYLESRFGPHAVRVVFKPLAGKIWRQPLDRLSPWAAKLIHLTRVVTHDQESAVLLKASPALDEVLGFPDQLSVPAHLLANRRRSFYPRRFGLTGLVNALQNVLEEHGVKVLTSSKVMSLAISNHRIDAIRVGSPDGERDIKVSSVLWTSPQFPLLGLLGLPAKPLPTPPIPHRIVHMFLDRQPQTGALYWLWSYDTDNLMVRIASPSAYCPQVAESGVFPLCVETHVPAATVSDEDVKAQVERELRATGLIASSTKIVGANVLQETKGYFVPTLDNCAGMAAQRKTINEQALSNLAVSTQDISAGIFYLADILSVSVPIMDNLE